MTMEVGPVPRRWTGVPGVVKFFKAGKGWGAVIAQDLPGDVWVHYSAIEADGWRDLEAGDVVDLDVEAVQQDSFSFRATRARFVRSGPVPTLRRSGDRVDVVPDGTPDTALTPKRTRP